MNSIFQEFVFPAIKRWLFAPFSNKVTNILLFTGVAIVSAPVLEHILIKILLQEVFDVNVPVNVPDVPAYIFGVLLMLIGALHNLSFKYIEYLYRKEEALEKKERKNKQIPHDIKIIEEILSLLPYENTHCWLECASHSGLRRDFVHNLEECEKFVTPPFLIYNCEVEKDKEELITCIKNFNKTCLGHLGAQEDKTGEMYLPPYHWKSQGKQSRERYYDQVRAVGDSASKLKGQYDSFITTVKQQGFVIGDI